MSSRDAQTKATDSKQAGSGQPATAQATSTGGALPEGTPGVVPSAPGGPVVVAAPPDLAAMRAELLAEIAAGLPPKKEYKEQQKSELREAVMYFETLRRSPWLPVNTDDLIRHMAAVATFAAEQVGHTVDASFLAGRDGDPHDAAPGKDDLPQSKR